MVKFILDTDLGSDCDDAGAMALMLKLEQLGECEVLCLTHCTSKEYGPVCMDAICNYYGRDIPIGTLKAGGFLLQDNYAEKVGKAFPHLLGPGRAEDAVGLLRKTLTASDDQSVVISAIGPLRNMEDLLLSEPDEICPLSGKDLVGLKVKSLVIMGGCFEKLTSGEFVNMKGEWNIICDIPAAKEVADHWPGEVVFSPFELGEKIITGGRLMRETPSDNPARKCYEIHGEMMGTGDQGRYSWDPCTVLYAIRGEGGLFRLSEVGKAAVDDEGITSFAAGEGQHRILLAKAGFDVIGDVIDGLMI